MRSLARLLAFCAVAGIGSGTAMPQEEGEAAVKSRVALAVARFAELPVDAETVVLKVCLVWNGAIPRAFRELGNQKVGARTVVVAVNPPFVDCDVLYVDSSTRDWRRVLAEPNSSALTISDAPGFLTAGGMIELVIVSDAVRFDVNLGELRKRGIRLSAQVLKLARLVRD